MRTHLLHCSYKCVMNRYGSFFHVGLLEIEQGTLDVLALPHRAKFKTQFGIDVDDVHAVQ